MDIAHTTPNYISTSTESEGQIQEKFRLFAEADF
jgi:hypothetical protein